jgi:hypothetical protein
MNKTIVVRYRAGAYHARCEGKTASCTACAEMAAEAVLPKLVGRERALAAKLVWISGDSSDTRRSTWVATLPDDETVSPCLRVRKGAA